MKFRDYFGLRFHLNFILGCDICYDYIYTMDRSFISRALLTWTIIVLLPFTGWAGIRPVKPVLLTDTAGYLRQDNKKEKSKEKPDGKQEPDKTDIPEVPRARKQSRPPVVSKPNIKVKPIKVIRPKIKKP